MSLAWCVAHASGTPVPAGFVPANGAWESPCGRLAGLPRGILNHQAAANGGAEPRGGTLRGHRTGRRGSMLPLSSRRYHAVLNLPAALRGSVLSPCSLLRVAVFDQKHCWHPETDRKKHRQITITGCGECEGQDPAANPARPLSARAPRSGNQSLTGGTHDHGGGVLSFGGGSLILAMLSPPFIRLARGGSLLFMIQEAIRIQPSIIMRLVGRLNLESPSRREPRSPHE